MKSNLNKRLENLEQAANPQERLTLRVVWDDEPAQPGDFVIYWDDEPEEESESEPFDG